MKHGWKVLSSPEHSRSCPAGAVTCVTSSTRQHLLRVTMWESVVKYVTWRWSDNFCTVKVSCATLNFDLSVVCRSANSWRLGCTRLSNFHVTFPASSQHFPSWCFQPHEQAAGTNPEPQNHRTPEPHGRQSWRKHSHHLLYRFSWCSESNPTKSQP